MDGENFRIAYDKYVNLSWSENLQYHFKETTSVNDVYEYYTGDAIKLNDNRLFSKIPMIAITPAMDAADAIGTFPLLFNGSVKVYYCDN